MDIRCSIYNVYTADQFAYLLNAVVVHKYINSNYNNNDRIKINILADIDMGGADNKDFATHQDTTYLKWTVQSKFTSADKGEHNVTFYWTLADGRFLSDTKLVKINVLQPCISKSVNLSYAEAGSNTLVYNVTYTNSDFASPVTFGVLDVLPFNGDTRLDYGVDNGGTEGDKVNFNLKSIRIKKSGIGTIQGVYYSTNETVRNYLTDSDGKPVTNAAMRLDVNETGKIDNANGYWNDITREGGGGGTYVPKTQMTQRVIM